MMHAATSWKHLKEEEFRANIGDVHFVQDNESKSSFGVLRGLHYQKGEYSQAKMVRVIKGKVWMLRSIYASSSPTFGKYVSGTEQKRTSVSSLFPHTGFAHGFLVLSEEVIFT